MAYKQDFLDKFRLRSFFFFFFFFVTSQDTVCSLMSRATTTHVEERESELELQRLDKKDEPGERSSERCHQFPAERKSRWAVHVS